MCRKSCGEAEESCCCTAEVPCDEAPEVEAPSGNERETVVADPLADKPGRNLEGFEA